MLCYAMLGALSVAARVLHSMPLFEAFGNARTNANRNSSRFGKHMQLLLTPSGAVRGVLEPQQRRVAPHATWSAVAAGRGRARAHLPSGEDARRRAAAAGRAQLPHILLTRRCRPPARRHRRGGLRLPST